MTSPAPPRPPGAHPLPRVLLLVGDPARADALRHTLAVNAGGRYAFSALAYTGVPLAGGAPTDAELSGYRAIVSWAERDGLAFNLRLNRALARTDARVVFAQLESATAATLACIDFGHGGVCLECFRYRRIAASRDAERALREEAVGREPAGTPRRGGSPDLSALYDAISLAVDEFAGDSGEAPRRGFGLVYRVDLRSGSRTRHLFLGRGACPIREAHGAATRVHHRVADRPADPSPFLDAYCGLATAVEPFAPEYHSCDRATAPHLLRLRASNWVLREETAPMYQYGKAWEPSRALLSAVGESIERYACYSPPAPKAFASPLEAGPAVEAFPNFSRAPAADAHPGGRSRLVPCVPGRRHVGGVEPDRVEAVRVPAAIVYPGWAGGSGAPPLAEGDARFVSNTNGVGCSTSFGGALRSALLEYIERDAFLVSWRSRVTRGRIDPSAGSARVRAFVERRAARGYRTVLNYLSYDDVGARVVAAISVCEGHDERRPAVAVGVAAGLTLAEAISRSVLEMELVFAGLSEVLASARGRAAARALGARPDRVTDVLHHGLYYCSPANVEHLDFWSEADYLPADTLSRVSAGEASVGRLLRDGGDFVSVDMTPPEIRRAGWHVVRVLDGVRLPIEFGRVDAQWAGAKLARRVSGLAEAGRWPYREDGLNPHPHPLC